MLMLSTLRKFSAADVSKYFSCFYQKTGFDISCKLSPMETICMKCTIPISGKNKKNIIKLLSAELAQRVAQVKSYHSCWRQANVWLTLSMLDKFFSRQHFEIFSYLFPVNKLWHFMQTVSSGDNLHKMSSPIFWEKIRTYHQFVICWICPVRGKG